MKKKFLLVGIIAAMGLGTFLVSCDKDEKKDLIGCTCTERYLGSIDVYSYSIRDMKNEYDATNCSQLARNIKTYDYAGDAEISCSELY